MGWWMIMGSLAMIVNIPNRFLVYWICLCDWDDVKLPPVMVAWRDGLSLGFTMWYCIVIGLVYCPWKVHWGWRTSPMKWRPCWEKSDSSLLKPSSGKTVSKSPVSEATCMIDLWFAKVNCDQIVIFSCFSILFLAFQSWLQFAFWNVHDKLNRNHPLRQSFSDFEWECAADSFAWPGNMQAGHCAF